MAFERRFQLRRGIRHILVIFQEGRILDPELELQFAKLGGLKARRCPQHVAESHVVDRGKRRQNIPRQGHYRLYPADPRHRLVSRGKTILVHKRDREIELVEHLLQPQLLGLVDDDEKHFIVEVRQRLLGAEKLVYLTDVAGIYEDFGDDGSLIAQTDVAGLEGLLDTGKVDEGMAPKVRSCIDALRSGVHRAHVLDGRIPHALLLEFFTRQGIGTMVSP